jgi:hypothetical protein
VQTENDKKVLSETGGIPIGIGKNAHIRKAIIDKNARIGENVKVILYKFLTPARQPVFYAFSGLTIHYAGVKIRGVSNISYLNINRLFLVLTFFCVNDSMCASLHPAALISNFLPK